MDHEEDYKRSDSSSIGSSCSLDMANHEEEEEVSSSSEGPLYELSDLMAQLPIKRGLSKFYDGKSESYTSLMGVRSIEDLLKKKKKKDRWGLCKQRLNKNKKKVFSPKATISKKIMKQCPRGPNSIATRPSIHALF